MSNNSDDHSNTASGATLIAANTLYPGIIETSLDDDYFRITVSGSGTLIIYTTGSLDTYGYLENSSGSTLSEDDDGSGNGYNFSISMPVTSGTYYIRVSSYGTQTGNYNLYAEFVSF